MAKTRKEIDKEAMFNKIMPSARLPAQDAPQVTKPGEAAPGDAAFDENAELETQDQFSAQPEPEDLPPMHPAMGIGVKRSVLDTRKGVVLGEGEPAALINLMERMVAEKLDAAFDKFHCCKCDKCKKDAAAIALNKLPPRYVVADKISALLEDRQTNSEVTTAIIQAILIVKAHPRH